MTTELQPQPLDASSDRGLDRGRASLLGTGFAVPDHRVTANQSCDFTLRALDADCRHSGLDPRQAETTRALVQRVHDRGGIESRHSVISDWLEPDPSRYSFFPPTPNLEPAPGTARRMEVYEQHAPALALESARRAMTACGITPHEITHLVVSTCTGFFAPGLDILLARQLDLPPQVSRTILGFMGCYAGIVGMRTAGHITASNPRAVVLQVCIELCSIHFRKDWSGDAIVSGALFGDGAAAAVWAGTDYLGLPVMANDGPSEEARPLAHLVATHSLVSPDTIDHMSWRITDAGFVMKLDVGVPAVLQNAAPPFVEELLRRAGLTRPEVAGWAIHPGGRRILEVLQTSLDLTDADLTSSFAVLRQYGNMSSSTILFVLEEELKRSDRMPGPVVCLAFGPGLTIEGAVLERLN